MMRTSNLLSLTLALALSPLATYARPVDPGLMIPDVGLTPVQSTGKTILVSPVTVSKMPEASWMGTRHDRIGPDIYTRAIVDTLTQTGLFMKVSTEGEENYQLSVDVADQQLIGGLSNIMLLLIRYRLTEETSGDVLWSENILSHYHLAASDEFMGAERSPKVAEGAVRHNLKQLVAGLNANLSP